MTKKTYDKEKYSQVMLKNKTKKRLARFNSFVAHIKKESYISCDEEINYFMDEFINQPIHVLLKKLSMKFPITTTVHSSDNTIMKTKFDSVTINS